MFNKLKTALNEYKTILIVITISIVCMFNLALINEIPFVYNADTLFEYHIFYEEWINLVKDFFSGNGLPMYSWNSFLGDDFYSAISFYVTGDIFLPLLMLFKDIETGLMVETIICIYLSAIFMNMFLKEFGIKNNNHRTFIGLVYALSGWQVLFVGQYMFTKFYAFIPLLFYGMEYYLNRRKAFVFIISITILFLSCYYFMFHTSIFLLIYGIFTCLNRSYDYKKILECGLKMIGLYLVGLMISSFLSVPSILNLLSNPRLGETYGNNIFWEIQTYFGMIISYITPANFMLNELFFASENWHDYWYSLMIGIIPLILSISICFKKEFKLYRNIFLVLLMFMLFRPLSSIMHGFSEPSLRWTHLLIFFMLIMAAKGLENIDFKTNNKIMLSYVILFVVSIISVYLMHNDNVNVLYIIICLIISVIIYFVFKYCNKYGLILAIIYLIMYNTQYFYITNQKFDDQKDTFFENEIVNAINVDNDIMFRYFIDNKHYTPINDLNLNQSLNHGYMGTSTYNSIYDSNILEFLKLNGYGDWHVIKLDNPDIMRMLGVKYYVVFDESELPSEYQFEYRFDLSHLKVYEKMDYIGFGYSNDNIKYLNEITDLSEFNNTTFIDDETIDISIYQDLSTSSFDIYERGNNHLKGYIYSEGNNILMLPIPNNSGWKVINNYEEVETISVNGGFIGVPLTSGDNNIEMYFVSNGFELGLILTGGGIVILIIILILEKKVNNEKN